MAKPKRYRGVSYHCGRGHEKYIVRVKSGPRIAVLGMFDDAKFAARVYDYAARLVHGPSAMLNLRHAEPPGEITERLVRKRLMAAGLIASDE